MGKTFTQKLAGRAGRIAHRARFRASLRHLHGPAHRSAAPDQVVLIALVRDGAYYLDVFFDHYRRLGVSAFVFFDNGSADGTIDRIRQEPDTAVLQSALPWLQYENTFRAYAADRYGRDRWCLFADMDELFDFEGSAAVGLGGLTRYLTQQGFTALQAEMLEMFPDGPLSAARGLTYAEAVQSFRFSDISTLQTVDYASEDTGFAYYLRQNTLPPGGAQMLFGGVRGKVFGETCCLSKHPLVFNGPGVQSAVHPHASAGVQLADMEGLIRHYKFAGDSLARDLQVQAETVSAHGEDRQRSGVMQAQPDLSLWSPEAIKDAEIADLQRRGFLRGSSAYRDFLAGEAA
ncbi:glycosyltransferase family 2 protein [Leisingera sp. SS27]|uniref:glycosyltransferase family 2 protein n=1 Tax=Leisingera sp. SS27 TaxID=2979462 RepID=UPI00232B9FB3|nr:glycosyltransferase family 2 protein [Leisingera sp. SS27]MDC0657549.1 glycosyltransferase family 2 protein [Leisingera sp. SS27]